MTEVGRSLIFYLRYFSEMQALYENEGSLPDLEKREDFDAISSKAKSVGRQACSEAADLLLRCTADLERRLNDPGIVKLRCCRRDTIERQWQVSIDLLPPRGRRPSDVRRQLGVYLDTLGITPWLWSRGGRPVEDQMKRLLPTVRCRGSREFDWNGGTVALNTVKIPWEKAKDFRVDAGPLVAKTTSLFTAITPRFVSAFMNDL